MAAGRGACYHFGMSRFKETGRAQGAFTLKPLVQAVKAIGHPSRLRILAMLERRALCVCQMTAVLEVASSTVSGHLNELRRSGLVAEDKKGKLVFYRLDHQGPFSDLVAKTLALARPDETIVHDRVLIDQVRAVPIEVLTGAGLKLGRLGIKRPPAARLLS